MMKEQLIRDIEHYVPFNEQETLDKATILAMLKDTADISRRDNLVAHLTASAWVVDPARTRVLMAYHNIYKSWAWTGGHADGETDLLSVALREAREETGAADIRPVADSIFALEILPVNAHVKRGAFVSAHLHLNLTYLLTADDARPVRPKPDENSAVAWLPLEAAADCREEPFMAVIYRKLNDKLRRSMNP